MKTFNIELTEQEMNNLRGVLGKVAFDIAAPIIVKMQQAIDHKKEGGKENGKSHNK